MISIAVANSPWAYHSSGHGASNVSHTCAGSIQGAQRCPSKVQISKGEVQKENAGAIVRGKNVLKRSL